MRTTATGLLLVTTFLPGLALAQTVELSLNPEAERVLAGQLRVAEQEIEGLMRERFEEAYRLLDIPEFLRVSANAQSLANKGLGVDYAADPALFVVGGAVSGAVDAGDSDLMSLESPEAALGAGAGLQLSLMAGLNLAVIGLPSVTVYANGLFYPLTIDDLDGELFNLGGHLQFALVRPKSLAVVGWLGLDFTTGLELSRMTLTLDGDQENSAPIRIDGRSYDVTSVSTGQLELTQRALTIPLELSTGLTILSFVSWYVGGGLDFMFGDASLDANLDSVITAEAPDGSPLDVGTARVVANNDGEPSTIFPRVFTGLQLHLGPLNVFGQMNLGMRDVAVSLAAGVRVSL